MAVADPLIWDELVDFLQRARIGRLLFEGIWDDDDGPAPPHFVTMSSPVYLDTDIGMLRIDLVNDSYLSFTVVDSPTWELFDESQIEKVGLINLGNAYFGDRGEVTCHQLDCALLSGDVLEIGEVLLMSMVVDGGELVTFNPWNISGLRVQGGVHLSAIIAGNAYLESITTVRTWLRKAGDA